jgi:hypothetical protein
MFRNMVIFYGEELLAPRPTPKLEDYPLSAVRDCIFATTLHIWRPFLHPQPEDAPCRGDRDRLSLLETKLYGKQCGDVCLCSPDRKRKYFFPVVQISRALSPPHGASSGCGKRRWRVAAVILLQNYKITAKHKYTFIL